MARCFDCLSEFAFDDERFAVIKQLRDEPDWPSDMDEAERRALRALLFDHVYVCGDCAGWYEDAWGVTAAEAGHA